MFKKIKILRFLVILILVLLILIIIGVMTTLFHSKTNERDDDSFATTAIIQNAIKSNI